MKALLRYLRVRRDSLRSRALSESSSESSFKCVGRVCVKTVASSRLIFFSHFFLHRCIKSESIDPSITPSLPPLIPPLPLSPRLPPSSTPLPPSPSLDLALSVALSRSPTRARARSLSLALSLARGLSLSHTLACLSSFVTVFFGFLS